MEIYLYAEASMFSHNITL